MEAAVKSKENAAEKVDVVKVDISKIKKYKLLNPVKVADKTYTELVLDFDSLTGADMEYAASLPNAVPKDGSTSEYSKTYLLYLAAKAAKIPYAEIKQFPIADCTGLTMLAYSFLMAGLTENIVS
jgi:hypothetical protein